MAAHDDHGRQRGVGGRRARASRPVRHHAVVAICLALALLGGATGAFALESNTVVVQDRADARENAPDLKRVAATRSADGGVRLALSLADKLVASDLLTDEDAGGPPGSICVRLWTVSKPATTKPDRLVCVTAQPDGKTLRATISKEVPGALPSTVGPATLTRLSDTSIALRIGADLLGRPRRLAFAGEATGPGCARLSCVDLAPDAGITKTLRLR